MQLKWFEDFLLLAETRSFSRAAEMRNVTQPAFGRRIRALETWLGTALVDRDTLPLVLTEDGRIFYEAARDVVQRLADARELLSSRDARSADVLVVAASHTLGTTHYAKLIGEVEAALGQLEARLSAINSHDGLLLLVDGGCDLVLSYYNADLGRVVDEDRYPHLVLGRDQLVPLSKPDADGRPLHALPGHPDRPTTYLTYTPSIFLARAVSCVVDRAPEPHNLRLSHQIEMAQTMRAMVAEGQGMGWIPASIAAEDVVAGRLVSALPGSAVPAQWCAPMEIRLYRSAENRKPILNRAWSLLARHRERSGTA